MSVRRQILRGLVVGLILVGLILLGVYLARLPKPKPRHIRSRLGTIWIGGYVGLYSEDNGVPPYSKHGSIDEYVEEAVRGVGGEPAAAVDQLKRDAKYAVLVNLTKEEWAAVRAFFETHQSLEDKLRATGPDPVIIVVGWQAIPEPDGDRMVMFMSGAIPESADTFRSEVRHLDRAIRTSLGKSLADCLLYEEKRFDPSTLELEDD